MRILPVFVGLAVVAFSQVQASLPPHYIRQDIDLKSPAASDLSQTPSSLNARARVSPNPSTPKRVKRDDIPEPDCDNEGSTFSVKHADRHLYEFCNDDGILDIR